MYAPITRSQLTLDRNIARLCRQPYYGHPQGCPNFNCRAGCPPQTQLLDQVLDLESDLFAIWTEFMVGEFAVKMCRKYPTWTDRQLFNPRL